MAAARDVDDLRQRRIGHRIGARPTWCVDGRLTLAEAQLIAHEAQHRRADGGPLARHDAVTPTVEQ